MNTRRRPDFNFCALRRNDEAILNASDLNGHLKFYLHKKYGRTRIADSIRKYLQEKGNDENGKNIFL